MALVGVAKVANVLNLTTRRVQQLVDEGMPKDGRGKYDPVKCMLWYIRFLQAALEKKVPVTESETVESYRAEKIRLTRAQADAAELDLREREGDLIETELVMDAWGEVVKNVRAKIMAVPTKLAALVLQCRTMPEAKETIENAIYEVMSEIAHPDLKEKSKRKSRAAGGTGVDDVQPAEPSDRKPVGRPRKGAKSRSVRGAGKVGDGKG